MIALESVYDCVGIGIWLCCTHSSPFVTVPVGVIDSYYDDSLSHTESSIEVTYDDPRLDKFTKCYALFVDE